MAIMSVRNQYRGVNAHLNAYFQEDGDFAPFHTDHISDIRVEINKQLRQQN